MENYAKKLPRDRNNEVMQEFATPFPALKILAVENASTSSVTALSSMTTMVEVGAVTTGAVIKWVTQSDLTANSSVVSAAAGANFDNFIPAGNVRRFVVPRRVQALSPASIAGVNIQEGLYNAVAMKSVGVGSVLLTEY